MTWPTKKLGEKISFIWRKKYLELFIVIAALGTPILYCSNSQINDYLIFYTLVVILWYSRETMDLKRNSSKELDRLRVEHKTNLRPYLRIQKKTGENKPQLVNVGKGVAVHLRSIYKQGKYEVKLPRITAMAAAPESVAEGLTPLKLGIDFESDQDCIIEILYNDIEGRNYHAVFKRNSDFNDKFEIVEQKEI